MLLSLRRTPDNGALDDSLLESVSEKLSEQRRLPCIGWTRQNTQEERSHAGLGGAALDTDVGQRAVVRQRRDPSRDDAVGEKERLERRYGIRTIRDRILPRE